MTTKDHIDAYVKGLERALRSLGEKDRADITAEIRAHLEHRAGESRLDEALMALGSPETCARGFVEELKLEAAYIDAGPAKTLGALLALATRRVSAAAGLFVSGFFFLLAIGFAATGVMEMTAPGVTGLWSNPAEGIFVFGSVINPPSGTSELLGGWFIPVATALALLSAVIGQGLGRFFIRLMMKRERP